MTENRKIDPDPFTLVDAACSIVGAVCMVGTLALQYRSERTRIPKRSTQPFIDQLQDTLNDATKHVRQLIRFLATVDGGTTDPLNQIFSYGETPLFLNYENFGDFERISSALLNDLQFSQKLTLSIIRHDPERAVQYGDMIISEVSDFKVRINSYRKGDLTNSQVLEDVLILLQTLDRLIGRLENQN